MNVGLPNQTLERTGLGLRVCREVAGRSEPEARRGSVPSLGVMKHLAFIFPAMVLLLCAGCFLPVPSVSHRVTSGNEIQAQDLSFVEPRVPLRSEFVRRFGEPWAYYSDLGVVVYYWETLRGYGVRYMPF